MNSVLVVVVVLVVAAVMSFLLIYHYCYAAERSAPGKTHYLWQNFTFLKSFNVFRLTEFLAVTSV